MINIVFGEHTLAAKAPQMSFVDIQSDPKHPLLAPHHVLVIIGVLLPHVDYKHHIRSGGLVLKLLHTP